MSSTDNMYVMVGFFASAIFILVLALVWTSISNVDFLWSQADVGGQIKSNTQSFVNNYDFIMICLYFGTHLAILALAYLLRSHPVILVAGVGITVLLVIMAAPLSNAYSNIISTSSLSTVSASFPMTNHIMSKLPFYELIWAIITMIVTYGFAKSEELF